MKSTDFDTKRIAEGYRNRPFLHREVIETFQEDIGGRHFGLGLDIGCGAYSVDKGIESHLRKGDWFGYLSGNDTRSTGGLRTG